MNNKLILYQFPPAKNLPNLSPPCMKLETYLRMANIPYEVKHSVNFKKSPTHKIPYIQVNNQYLSDSGLIIDQLEQQSDHPVDQHLTPQQHVQALALRRLLEEHFYWGLVWSRWVDPEGFQHSRKIFTAGMPKPLRWVIHFLRHKARRQLYQQGLGRFTPEQIVTLMKQDISVITTQLDREAFLFGKQPCTVDACCYAYIGSYWSMPWPNPIKIALCDNPTLLDYYGRMIKLYFPKYPSHFPLPTTSSSPAVNVGRPLN